MARPIFLQREPLTRLGVAALLAAGGAMPLWMAFGLEGQALIAGLTLLLVLCLLTALTVTRKARILLYALIGAFLGVQAFLPNAGALGGALDAAKALMLYFNDLPAAVTLYGAQVALLIAVVSAVLGFLFARRGVGFLPAAFLVVLVLFGLWSLGRAELFWWSFPALVALLLLLAQNAHEKINLLHVLPMALAAVLAAFLLLPRGGVSVEPLHGAAMDLKQRISDYLFFTEPRNVFTLGSYGYYPMGAGRLGGEAEPSEYPVMIVKTDRKTLLRAVSKDEYTGRSFRDTSGARRYLYINPRWAAQRSRAFLESLPAQAVRKATHLLDEKAVSVQMQNTAASTVFTPTFLRSVSMQSDMVAYFNDASELFITRDLQSGDSYTVYAPILEGGDSGLDAIVSAARRTDANYQSVYSTYTQLPDHMEAQVFSDVQEIVAGAETPYDKALAIMRHLQRYYKYTLTPSAPPENQDFVTFFLYRGKEGYCTYFAAAMTVMCRMANLPARYVEGFLAQPSGDGFAYVAGKDAHAWTEVYFEGFGWVPFDPTPAQQEGSDAPPSSDSNPEPSPSPSPSPDPQNTPTPNPNQPDDQPTPEPDPEQTPEPQRDEPNEDPQQENDPPPFPWWLLIVLAALAALSARVALRMPERMAARQKGEREKIFVYGAAVMTLLRLNRREPRAGEAPMAFARRTDQVKAAPAPILPLWRILTLSHYSRMEPGPKQTERAKETYTRVYRAQPLWQKLRFWLCAGFSKRCYTALDTPAPHDPPKAIKPPLGPKKGKGAKRAKRVKGAKQK